MPVFKTEFACRLCKDATGKSVQIVAVGGKLECPNGHSWNDTATFQAMHGKDMMEFKVAPPVFPPQQNHTPITVTVPNSVKDAAQAKFGDKLNPTIAGLLQMLCEGDILIINATDLQRISDKLGKRPSSSSELYGMIYALGCEMEDAKQITESAQRDLKAYEGMAPGRVVVDLGDQYSECVERSKTAGQPLKFWVESNLRNAVKDNWF
jgi:hypothetical protein